MSCGMKLCLEGKTIGINDVRKFRPEDLKNRGGRIYNNTQATDINTYEKTITAKNVKTGETVKFPYDKLIISTGVNPAKLDLPGVDLKNIYLMRGFDWAEKSTVRNMMKTLRMSPLSELVTGLLPPM